MRQVISSTGYGFVLCSRRSDSCSAYVDLADQPGPVSLYLPWAQIRFQDGWKLIVSFPVFAPCPGWNSHKHCDNNGIAQRSRAGLPGAPAFNIVQSSRNQFIVIDGERTNGTVRSRAEGRPGRTVPCSNIIRTNPTGAGERSTDYQFVVIEGEA